MLSTKGHCHQSNANMGFQSGVWQKEKLYSRKIICKWEELSLWEKLKVSSPETKGSLLYIEKAPTPVPNWSIFV